MLKPHVRASIRLSAGAVRGTWYVIYDGLRRSGASAFTVYAPFRFPSQSLCLLWGSIAAADIIRLKYNNKLE